MDFSAIGQQFVQHYYNVIDTNRPVSLLEYWVLNSNLRSSTLTIPCLASRVISSRVLHKSSTNSALSARSSMWSRASMPSLPLTMASYALSQVIFLLTGVRILSSLLRSSISSLEVQLASSASMICSDSTTAEQMSMGFLCHSDIIFECVRK